MGQREKYSLNECDVIVITLKRHMTIKDETTLRKTDLGSYYQLTRKIITFAVILKSDTLSSRML